MRFPVRPFLLVAALPALASPLPAWWRALPRQPVLAARFTQVSDSDVFGKLQQSGSLVIARGGKLRVAYDSGLLVVSDGRQLVQYDPDTRTAERMDLQQAIRDIPLLGLLLDPARIGTFYRVEGRPDGSVHLRPRAAGLPDVQVEGRNGLLRALSWTDGTGARQRLDLLDPKVPSRTSPSVFHFEAPKGTRWATANR